MTTLKNVDIGNCPFCGNDPYEYVDVGIGMDPVAVTCCSAGIAYFQYGKTLKQIHIMQRQLKREEKKHGNIMDQKDAISLT